MAKNLLDIDHKRAEIFFYRNEVYFDGYLPRYFHFSRLLFAIKKALSAPENNNLKFNNKKLCKETNYTIYANKDGKYDWRKLDIINPFLYVTLVSEITNKESWDAIVERFKLLSSKCANKIISTSIPVVESRKKKSLKASQILEWWEKTEQHSLIMALHYRHVFTADIKDCYPSIYTHTIAWALHDKQVAKTRRKDMTLIGNKIDFLIQNMQHGQTNGIPQGSALMDFIAEMVLAYADVELYNSLNAYSLDYKIIRYRDDYKIFVNSEFDGEIIIRELTKVLMDLNLKLNKQKTHIHKSIVSGSIKNDKLSLMQVEIPCNRYSPQKNLLLVDNFLMTNPNSKQMAKPLFLIAENLEKCIDTLSMTERQVLLSLVVQIAYGHPVLYAECCQLISIILQSFEAEEVLSYLELITAKFKDKPHHSIMDIFLQRISLPYNYAIGCDEKICSIVDGSLKQSELWNLEFLPKSNEFKKLINNTGYVQRGIICNLGKVIKRSEIDIFMFNGQSS